MDTSELPKGQSLSASEVSTPTNVGSSFRVLVSVPDTKFLRAKFLIFMAAFTSRFSTAPQFLQVHSRSCKVSSLFTLPQLEQHFEDGSNRPMRKMFLPYQSALYSSIFTKVDHAQSEIDWARRWFLSILATCRFSIAIDWFSLISLVEILCKKSFRWLATFSCSFTSRCLVRLPLCLEYLHCTNFNLLCALRKNFGLSKVCPSEATKKDLIPKSIPTVVLSFTAFFLLTISPVSQSIETKYLPVGDLLMVACLIVPLMGRCKTISTPSLNFGMTSLHPSKETDCGTLKLPAFDFLLNFGKSPSPLKNRVKALSKFLIGCCKDWLLISLNHSHSLFKSGNCLIKSKQLRFTLLPAYAACLTSNARLYTNRHEPICLFSKVACSFVGDRRNLNAFNTKQIYRKSFFSLKSFFNHVSERNDAYIQIAFSGLAFRSKIFKMDTNKKDDLVKGERNMENTGSGWDKDAAGNTQSASNIPPTGTTETGADETDLGEGLESGASQEAPERGTDIPRL